MRSGPGDSLDRSLAGRDKPAGNATFALAVGACNGPVPVARTAGIIAGGSARDRAGPPSESRESVNPTPVGDPGRNSGYSDGEPAVSRRGLEVAQQRLGALRRVPQMSKPEPTGEAHEQAHVDFDGRPEDRGGEV